jgi:hypothetical protein
MAPPAHRRRTDAEQTANVRALTVAGILIGRPGHSSRLVTRRPLPRWHEPMGSGISPVVNGATVSGMTQWPEGWHPVNATEAQDYIDAHPGGGGDLELLEECQSFLPMSPPS